MLKRRLIREVLIVVGSAACVVGCLSFGKTLSSQEKLFVVISLCGLLALSLILAQLERIMRKRLLSMRTPVSLPEFVAQYAIQINLPVARVLSAWQLIAAELRVDPCLLRQDDTLVILFPLPHWLSPCEWGDAGCLVSIVEQAVTQGIPHPERLETIDDFLRFFAEYPHAIKSLGKTHVNAPLPS
ncbi:MAG: hypothetical protein ACYDBB_01845 [Armatimonadota bacterium]